MLQYVIVAVAILGSVIFFVLRFYNKVKNAKLAAQNGCEAGCAGCTCGAKK